MATVGPGRPRRVTTESWLNCVLKSTNELRLKNKLSTQTAKQAYKAIIAADKVLGLKLETAKIPPNILALAKKRELFRGNKQFTQADALRKEIEALGFNIEDTPTGPLILRN